MRGNTEEGRRGVCGVTANMLTWPGSAELSDGTIVTENRWMRQEVASENSGCGGQGRGGKGKEGEVPEPLRQGWLGGGAASSKPRPPSGPRQTTSLKDNDGDGMQAREQH